MLPKQNRIQSRGEFTYIYSHGIRVKGVFGTLVAVVPNREYEANIRVGFSIPKKVGGAVQRNLMKRRLSSVFAQWVKKLPQDNKLKLSLVFYAYKFAEDFNELEKEFNESCDNILKKISAPAR